MTGSTLVASTTLDKLAAAMTLGRPNHAALTGGWASVDDTNTGLRQPNTAPPKSDPEVLPEEGRWPERLMARFYFFQKDPALERANPDGTVQQHNVLEAADVLISAAPGRTGVFNVLYAASGTAVTQLNRALRDAARRDDKDAHINKDGGALEFSPDLILWLLTRLRDDRELDKHTSVVDVLATGSRDSSRRNTRLRDGVDFDRPALLVAVAEVDQLGPIVVEFRDSELQAKISVELYPAGQFGVVKSATHYPNIVGDPETRVESLHDMAFDILPKVKALYGADEDWAATGRAKEIRAAANSLTARYLNQVKALNKAEAAKE